MTKSVGEHGLLCLDGDDFAAFALAMECNAQALDAALTEQGDALDIALERPYLTWANSSPQVIFDDNSGGEIGPEDLVGTMLAPGGSNTLASSGITVATGGWPIGFYLIGSTINWTVATPNANTRRMLMTFAIDTINGQTSAVSTYRDLYVATDYEGTTGNNGALTSIGMLENVGNLNSVRSFFTHRNTSSTINVAAGQWRGWAFYLGTGRVI
jgi:hypothetical protein